MRTSLAALVVVLGGVAGCGHQETADAGMDAPARDAPASEVATDTPSLDAPDTSPAPDAAPDAPVDSPSIDAPRLDAPRFDAPTDAGMCMDLPPSSDRPVAGACSACRPIGPEPGELLGECGLHRDCTAGANGRCVFGFLGYYCSYDECFTDADCAANEVCSCDGDGPGGANVCVPSECHTNSDCTSGACSPSYGCLEGGGPVGWYCRTAADLCDVDAECTAGIGGRCAYEAARGLWACDYGICVP